MKKNEPTASPQSEAAASKKSTLRRNVLFALAVLALAASLWGWRRLTAQAGGIATVDFGTGTKETIYLAKDGRYDYEVNGYTVHLEVRDGAVAFVESECPDHVCEAFGWLSAEGDWACCMPEGAYLVVEKARQ